MTPKKNQVKCEMVECKQKAIWQGWAKDIPLELFYCDDCKKYQNDFFKKDWKKWRKLK